MQANEAGKDYPGSGSTVAQMFQLADEYNGAAYLLVGQEDPCRLLLFAPARLCVIQAIELYLSAFLLFQGLEPPEIRRFQHGLIQRAEEAKARGLALKTATLRKLEELDASREYLLVRYAPDRSADLMELPRLYSAMKDVRLKVQATIFEQPYGYDDPRFKKYW